MGHPFCPQEGLNKFLDSLCGGSEKSKSIDSNLNDDAVKMMIKGKIVLRKKNVLDTTDQGAYFLDWVYELFGKGVTLQLISSVHGDPEQGLKGKRGKTTSLGKWSNIPTPVTSSDVAFDVSLEWDESIGLPGAFIVKNNHRNQFYLKTLTLEDIPNHGKVHFVCNSWVYPAKRYKYDRVFFSNKTYLPGDMPKTLQPYREQELKNLQGNGSGSGMLKEWDRVYDYAYYNDLGSPEKGKDFARPVLGGTKEYPYPRRGKTGRAPNKKDSKTESRLMLLSLDIYVPRDERFNQVKFSDFLGYAAKSLIQILVAGVTSVFDKTPTEFDKFRDVLELYKDGVELPPGVTLTKLRKCIPWELFQEITRSDAGEPLHKFPMPDVIKVNESAWRTDEEFAREMLAGVNPVSISRLKEFPAKSKLNPEVYGNQTSTITREQVEKNMTGLGLTVDEAIECNKMFILDHHDALMPYLRKINTTNSKIYASRTILVLQNDGTLKPLAIELSLPHPQGDKHGVTSHIFTPAHEGIEGHIWQLAKAYAAVNDSGYHQLVSHWLNTHAVIEPFVIATNRQLSVVHPIYKLLHPHFRDTMNINALARQILINAGGVLEMTVFPAKYSMEMSSAVYKDWILNEQSLPADLLKRGVAVEDPTKENGVRLLIEDYPFAVDGLEIWSAIETWVHEYCCIYYPTDESIQSDTELQTWWTELREEGHGDKKDETWWPKMQTRDELIKTCAIVIWVASALHAAVNFGQYSYAGYLPNRPTVSRRFMPEPGTAEYRELESDPELAFLKTITAQFQTLLGVSLIEILSRHASDEIYLGQRETQEWTTDIEALEAFDRFGSNLKAIEQNIERRNNDKTLKNRVGPVNIPYTLLYPNTTADTKDPTNVGLSGKGIPNSVSI